ARDEPQAALAPVPADHGFDASHQLLERKRLGDVVIGAELEARDPVADRGAGADAYERGVGLRPEALEEVGAVVVGQHQVQEHDVRIPFPDQLQAPPGGLHRTDRVALLAEAGGDRPRQAPAQLAEAVVAIEDERFYQHHGIDSVGLGRAVLYDATNLCLCQGGSTVTEQLVKDVFLGGSDRGYNKLQDMVLALKVERVLTKKQIMADYLSEITTGFGRYGVAAAACAYFQAPLPELTLGQYALLAGMTQ